jgi:hypothetical protein
MSTIITKSCDRCGKKPINRDYTLAVSVRAVLPDGGGWSTGSELDARFDFCQECKNEVQK